MIIDLFNFSNRKKYSLVMSQATSDICCWARICNSLAGDWKMLARQLGFSEEDIQIFEATGPSTAGNNMLLAWARSIALKSPALSQALVNMGRTDLVGVIGDRFASDRNTSGRQHVQEQVKLDGVSNGRIVLYHDLMGHCYSDHLTLARQIASAVNGISALGGQLQQLASGNFSGTDISIWSQQNETGATQLLQRAANVGITIAQMVTALEKAGMRVLGAELKRKYLN